MGLTCSERRHPAGNFSATVSDSSRMQPARAIGNWTTGTRVVPPRRFVARFNGNWLLGARAGDSEIAANAFWRETRRLRANRIKTFPADPVRCLTLFGFDPDLSVAIGKEGSTMNVLESMLLGKFVFAFCNICYCKI